MINAFVCIMTIPCHNKNLASFYRSILCAVKLALTINICENRWYPFAPQWKKSKRMIWVIVDSQYYVITIQDKRITGSVKTDNDDSKIFQYFSKVISTVSIFPSFFFTPWQKNISKTVKRNRNRRFVQFHKIDWFTLHFCAMQS